MRIKICIDIWRDVFDWLPPYREQIVRKSNRINDREFSDLLQKWLHEWTKNVCLGPIAIELCQSDDDKKSAQLQCLGKNGYVNFPFAEVEMPDNIRDFSRIHISYLDSTVISFLQRMQPLFHNKVNLDVNSLEESGQPFETTSTALGHLIPLLNGGIKTIELFNANLLFTIRDRFPAQFFGVKFFIVWLWNNMPPAELTESLLEWLVTRRQDSQPRMLMLRAYKNAAWALEFIERIRQQVINANSSASFFIWITHLRVEFQESTTHNTGTNEQLVIRRDGLHLLIGRCPSNVDGQKWVEEMAQEARETEAQTERRMISIYDPKLGPFEEAELEEKEKSEEDVDQPGPSNKKPKLLMSRDPAISRS